jgi:hypothetical protein
VVVEQVLVPDTDPQLPWLQLAACRDHNRNSQIPGTIAAAEEPASEPDEQDEEETDEEGGLQAHLLFNKPNPKAYIYMRTHAPEEPRGRPHATVHAGLTEDDEEGEEGEGLTEDEDEGIPDELGQGIHTGLGGF